MQKYYTVQHIADDLGVSKKTIFRYIKAGLLPAQKIGQWKIFEKDYRHFLRSHQPQQKKIKVIKPRLATITRVPLFLSAVQAGFPSPAEDFIEESLDLNTYLIKNKPATFLVRVEGYSMVDAGIHPRDILVVDRSLEPRNGKIVIAVVDGELTVKRIAKQDDRLYLLPENKSFHAIEIKNDADFRIWGVVTNVIHAL